MRPHLDYGDVIYHNQRKYLMRLLEQVQYKATVIVSGCWQGTNRTKLYDELGWESLADRRGSPHDYFLQNKKRNCACVFI